MFFIVDVTLLKFFNGCISNFTFSIKTKSWFVGRKIPNSLLIELSALGSVFVVVVVSFVCVHMDVCVNVWLSFY